MILVLQNRYRTTGGEERAAEDLGWLAREHLGERVQQLDRDSAGLGRVAAARGLLTGGLDPAEVAGAVRASGAQIVHAHNLLPAFGWRALAAARAAGAATVLHLHNYRLVCAVATCVDPAGRDCVRCHARDTLPGVRLGCRGSRAEGAAYAVALALWQRRLLAQADVVAVPSAAAEDRLRTLGAPLPGGVHVVPHVVRAADGAADGAAVPGARVGGPVLVVSRLAAEKGVDVAIAACAGAGAGLMVAGDGPRAGALRDDARAAGLEVLEGPGPAPGPGEVRFTGQVARDGLAALRADGGVEVVPSRAHETFGLSAVEALAAGVPVVASAVGALATLPAPVHLVPPGDAGALAAAIRAATDPAAVAQARAAGPGVAARLAGPARVAPLLAEVYAAARGARAAARH